MTETLPDGWARSKLSAIAESLQNGCGTRQSITGAPTVVLRLADVGIDGRIAADGLRRVALSEAERMSYSLRSGDLLVFRVNGSQSIAGRVVAYRGPDGYAFCDHFIRIRLKPGVSSELVAWQLSQGPARAFIEDGMVTSAGQNTVSQKTLANVSVALPPPGKQVELVTRLQRIRSRAANARAAFESMPQLIERLRQSILAAAFRGDLTADWRAAHLDVEPASDLLKRIRSERRRRWEEAERNRLLAKGKPPTDDRWKAKYEEPEPVDDTDLPELPGSWCWVSIAEIAHIGAGLTKNADKRASATEIVPLVSVAAVYMREIRPEGVGAIGLLPEDEDRGKLEPGDLLVVEGNGSLDQVGRVAIWRSEIHNARHQNHLIRLRPVMIAPEYVLEWLASPPGREELEDEATSGAGLYTLSLSKVGRVRMPLAPAREQEVIMGRLADRLLGLRRLEARLQPADDLLDRIDRAILSRAFSGDYENDNAQTERSRSATRTATK